MKPEYVRRFGLGLVPRVEEVRLVANRPGTAGLRQERIIGGYGKYGSSSVRQSYPSGREFGPPASVRDGRQGSPAGAMISFSGWPRLRINPMVLYRLLFLFLECRTPMGLTAKAAAEVANVAEIGSS